MAIRISTVENYALSVIDTTNESNPLLYQPKGQTWFSEEALDAGYVKFYGTTGTNEDNIKNYSKNDPSFLGFDLAQCVDGNDSDTPFTAESFRTWCGENLVGFNVGGATSLTTELVNKSNYIDKLSSIDSTKLYFIDEIIDIGVLSIEIPSTGAYFEGHNFDLSGLISTENNHTIFVSPVGGSGNLLYNNIFLSTSGTASKVYDLTDSDGTHTIEISAVNFNNCTSLGEINGYRQGLEFNTGRFGGTPELTFSGNQNGYRASTTIVRGISNISSLFKTGTSLLFSGRFIVGMNLDLPTTGAFIDFSDINFANDESLQLEDCRITRNGVLNSSDTNIYPNINESNVKSLWTDNAGIPNTQKYIKASITTEVITTIALANTYYPLEGTFTVDESSHFDMPSNGEFQLLSGNGKYQVTGDIQIDGNANDVIDIRVTSSNDGGVTFPTVINHIRRQVNSFVGGRDVAFFPINFIASIKENERLRLEVENTTAARDVTAELDSYFIITAI